MDFLLINSSKNKNVTINNVTYYNPTQILEDSSPFLEIMPELNHLKNNMMSEIGSHINTLLNYCESNGIVVGIGSNPNRNNSFDLLSPYVEIDANEPAAEIGNTKESEIGKLHFLLHDLIHVSLGRPSITNVDLKNKKETKKRLIKILLQQEVLASVWSGYYYSRWYWNIREKLNPSAIFYNQGLTSPLNLKLDEVIQFYSLYMHGHFLKFFLFIKKHFNYEYFEKVKQHKIPLCFQPPKKLKLKFFDKIKDHLLLPMGASIFIFFDKKFGFSALNTFVSDLADYYLSNEYVELCERFGVGNNLNDMESKLNSCRIRFTKGAFFINNSSPNFYKNPASGPLNRLKTHVIESARKLIEIKNINNDVSENVELYMQRLKELNLRIIELLSNCKNSSAVLSEYSILVKTYDQLLTEIDKNINTAKFFPQEQIQRLAHHFWKDPHSYVIDKPKNLKKFVNEYDIKKLSQLKSNLELEALVKLIRLKNTQVVDDYKTIKAYELSCLKNQVYENVSNLNYSSQIDHFNKKIEAMFFEYENFIFEDCENLSYQVKWDIQKNLHIFIFELKKNTQLLKEFYIEKYEKLNSSELLSEELRNIQANIKWILLELKLKLDSAIFNYRRNSTKKNLKTVLGFFKSIEKYNHDLKYKKIFRPSLALGLQEVYPYKSKRLINSFLYIYYIVFKKMDYNNFLKSIQIPENTITLMNNSNYSSEHQKSLPNLENNTNIYIFAMNHNQVFLDLKSMRIAADYFKVKNFYTINNSSFWPSFCLTGNTDPTFMHIQMPDLYHKLLKKTETDSQSTLIFIYPEGDLPFQSINMPLVSNLGAFIYARRFANYFKNKRNVYLIEAFSNYIDVKNINFQPTIVIDSIEKVPDRPIELNDCWAFKKRLNFENKSNLFRQIPFHTINNLKETFCDKQVI